MSLYIYIFVIHPHYTNIHLQINFMIIHTTISLCKLPFCCLIMIQKYFIIQIAKDKEVDVMVSSIILYYCYSDFGGC